MTRLTGKLADQRNNYHVVFTKAWDEWQEEQGIVAPMGEKWVDTIDLFFMKQVPEALIEEAVMIAFLNCYVDEDKIFRYFCGIIWNNIRQATIRGW